MNVPSDKTAPRRRKTVARRVPAAFEQPERKPMAFGWGADLNHREREALKERLALFAGLALAAILVIALGWGWYQDNVAHPAAVRAANNKPIAQVGTYTIRMGFFKRFEQFQQNQANNQLQQVQQYLAQLQANPKDAAKNAASIAQLQSEQNSLQQQLSSLPSQSLTGLIADQVVLQRSYTAGVRNTPSVAQKAWIAAEKQAGGRRHLAAFVAQSGLTEPEMRTLFTAQSLQSAVQSKLNKNVAHVQTEVRASHILLPPSKKAEAVKLLHQAESGANFAALARRYSTDTASAKKGGDLGYFPHGQMVPQFDKAAFALKPGQFALVKSQFGWHVIKATGRKRVRLTATEYQQAQQTAFSTWLSTQQDLLHIQRFVAPAALPNLQSTATASGSQLPGTQPGAVPGGVQGQAPSGSNQPAVVGTGKTSSKSGSGKSSSKSGSGKSSSKSGNTTKK